MQCKIQYKVFFYQILAQHTQTHSLWATQDKEWRPQWEGKMLWSSVANDHAATVHVVLLFIASLTPLLFYDLLQTVNEANANVCDENKQMSIKVRSRRLILTNDDDDDDQYYNCQDAPHLQEVNVQQIQMHRHSSEWGRTATAWKVFIYLHVLPPVLPL